MRLFVDADACPVVPQCLEEAGRAGVPVTLVCDQAHRMERPGAETVTVSQGADSADFALVNRVQPGDVVVTQDYGLAAMCLARGARAISQDGLEYGDENISALLLARHAAKKIRNAGGRLKGSPKRAPKQDQAFEEAFARLIGLK